MALTLNHSLNEEQVSAFSTSIGGTPIVAYVRVPFRCKVTKVGVAQNGAVTGTTTVATAITGTAITGGSITVTAGSAGTVFTATPTAANSANEDDVISFTSSGGTGTVQGHFFAVLRKA